MPSNIVTVEKVKGSPAPLDAAEKAHHPINGKKAFNNPWPSWKELDPEAVKAHLKSRNWLASWTHSSTAEVKIPVVEPIFFTERLGKDALNLRATWLGHACFLVEFPSGLRALFDPVMTDRCSPFSWAGPKRFTHAPCEIKDIPLVDIVIISHNHYDHLSHPSVMELHKSQPKAHFFVPLGNESWFRSCGIQNITELDWWEEVDFSLSLNQEETGETAISARISCLPAQHNSGRSLFDTNKTLWASWGVKSPCQPLNSSAGVASVFFGGDTGYRSVPTLVDQSDDWGEAYKDLPVCPAFSQIGKLHGPFSLGLLPIGAYEPRALMAPMHGNPRDAVEIFRDTGCKRALAMHWGTWVMGDEHIGEPPKKLAEALTARGLPERGIFDVCNAGESVLIPI